MIEQIITKRQSKFIGRILSIQYIIALLQLLTATNFGKISVGRPASTTITSITKKTNQTLHLLNNDDDIKNRLASPTTKRYGQE